MGLKTFSVFRINFIISFCIYCHITVLLSYWKLDPEPYEL